MEILLNQRLTYNYPSRYRDMPSVLWIDSFNPNIITINVERSYHDFYGSRYRKIQFIDIRENINHCYTLLQPAEFVNSSTEIKSKNTGEMHQFYSVL